MIYRLVALVLSIIALTYCSSLAATNEIIITEADGSSKTNYPVTIGRSFKRGEIEDYPIAVYNGINITTQANVKKRWDDGSVKHAIISFLIDFNSGQSKTISFANQASGNTTALTKSTMLDAGYDFDAKISTDFGGGDIDTSARAMLNADKYESFAPGSVANQIVIADHSLTRAFDFGADANKSLRPMFVATFYPTINKVKVRFVVENASTEVLQDQAYAVELFAGNSLPSSRYTKATFTHRGGTRWTKEYWIGGDPGKVNINHNAEYLAETDQVFKFGNLTISESTLSSNYSTWTSAAKDINDSAMLEKAAGTSGLRPEIGPYPRWYVLWLLTGDSRMEEISRGIADLAAGFPVHYREGDNTKYLDVADTVPGIGRPISVSNRASIAIGNGYSYSYTYPSDRITTVGTVTTGGWQAERSHQGDYYSLPYLLTGDYWYLEQGMFYASFNEAYTNGAAYNYDYGRGPTGAEGAVIGDQVRGEAWTLRQLVDIAAVVPDDFPEKDLYESWIDNFVAIEEGRFNITTTQNNGNTLWNWGRTKRASGLSPAPLHQLAISGSAAFAQSGYGINTSVTGTAISLFEQHYMMIAIGRAKQLGYHVTSLYNYLSIFYKYSYDENYNKFLLANGRLPIKKVDTNFFTTFSELETGYDCSIASCSNYYIDIGYYWGYPFVLRSALSFIANYDSSTAALYDYVENYLYSAVGNAVEVNPQWYLYKADTMHTVHQSLLPTSYRIPGGVPYGIVQ